MVNHLVRSSQLYKSADLYIDFTISLDPVDGFWQLKSHKNFLHQYLINLVQTFELDHMPIKQLLEVNLFIIHFKTTKFCLIGLQFCASIYKFAKSCCSEKILQQKNWSHFSYLKAVDQSY